MESDCKEVRWACTTKAGWKFPFIAITIERDGKTVLDMDDTPLVFRREPRFTKGSCPE